MCPQHELSIVREIKGILHISGWVVLWTVEGFETVVICLNLWRVFAFSDCIVSQFGKDINSLFHGHAEWMAPSNVGRARRSRQCDINFLRFHFPFNLRQHQCLHSFLNRCFQVILDLIDNGTKFGLVLVGKETHVAHDLVDGSLFAQVFSADCLGIGERLGLAHFFVKLDFLLPQFFRDIFNGHLLLLLLVRTHSQLLQLLLLHRASGLA
jgi:hypothetical protein